MPADVLELLRASYPAILGHAMDVGLVTFLALRWDRLRTTRGLLTLALFLAGCGLTYNASPVHFGLLLPLLLIAASLNPPLQGRRGLVLGTLFGALLALAYYGRYASGLFRKLVASGPLEADAPSLAQRADTALGGWDAGMGLPFVAAALVGLGVVLRASWVPACGRVIAAWAAYVPLISLPVLVLPEPFHYFRRLYFALPLASLLAARAGGRRRALTAALTVLLLIWSGWKMTSYVRPFFVTHTGSLAPE
jgi:hypothetical protein